MTNQNPADSRQPIQPNDNDLVNSQKVLEAMQTSFIEALINQAGKRQWEEILKEPTSKAVRDALRAMLERDDMRIVIGSALQQALDEAITQRYRELKEILADFEARMAEIKGNAARSVASVSESVQEATRKAVLKAVDIKELDRALTNPALGTRHGHRQKHDGSFFSRLFRSIAVAPHFLLGIVATLVVVLLGLVSLNFFSTQDKIDEIWQSYSGRQWNQTAPTEPAWRSASATTEAEDRPEASNQPEHQEDRDKDADKPAIRAAGEERFACLDPDHTSSINFRSTPTDATGENKVGKIYHDDIFRVIGTRYTDDRQWLNLERPGDFQVGWAAASYMVSCDRDGNLLDNGDGGP